MYIENNREQCLKRYMIDKYLLCQWAKNPLKVTTAKTTIELIDGNMSR